MPPFGMLLSSLNVMQQTVKLLLVTGGVLWCMTLNCSCRKRNAWTEPPQVEEETSEEVIQQESHNRSCEQAKQYPKIDRYREKERQQ